jgi:hypothetical protein
MDGTRLDGLLKDLGIFGLELMMDVMVQLERLCRALGR